MWSYSVRPDGDAIWRRSTVAWSMLSSIRKSVRSSAISATLWFVGKLEADNVRPAVSRRSKRSPSRLIAFAVAVSSSTLLSGGDTDGSEGGPALGSLTMGFRFASSELSS